MNNINRKQKEQFIEFLKTGTLGIYAVGLEKYPKDDLSYENTGDYGDVLYAYEPFYYLFSYKDCITTIGINVWQKEFTSFLKKELLINRKNTKHIFKFLKLNDIKFEIYALYSHNTQISIKLASNVLLYFQLNKSNDFELHKISRPM